MDFFARQDQARKNTKWLVVYFALAVVLIAASVYLVTLFAFHSATSYRQPTQAPPFSFWNPRLLLFAAGGTLAVIACGSLFKISQLSSGGRAVAESLGGRLVGPNTRDADERKLMNVVEEMAIASGVPVPKVYVMDQEQGINAFAAGHTINDAAIGVTRGCITTLNRDELQGVIAHEFSHILNGDMRLNLRLMGIIFGILCLAVMGRILLHSRGGGRDKNFLPLLGIVLVILGWLGVFFGQLIQAAVSRQREFLADAAAVQFTRNPDGIAGALKKIGSAQYGSQVQSEHAAEASHMFFGSALRGALFNAFATHPPLPERIRAIDPHWDGKFVVAKKESPPAVRAGEKTERRPAIPPIIPGLPIVAAGLAGAAANVPASRVMPTLGNPTPGHLRYAEELRESLPEQIRDAAHDPEGACAILYALVLSEEAAQRQTQLAHLAESVGAEIRARLEALQPQVSSIARRARLPLVNLALPALRQLTPARFQEFSQGLTWLIESDRRIALFEFMLLKIVRHQLEPHFAGTRPRAAQYYSIKPLAPDCEVLLSALAYVGHEDAKEVATAFATGAPHARTASVGLSLLPRERCGLAQINQALDRLGLAVPQIKKNVLAAGVQVVAADGVIRENEAELLRAIAETLDCPLPPLIEIRE